MKRGPFICGLLIGCILACAFFAFLSNKDKTHSASGVGTQRELKIAHSMPADHPVHKAIEHFAASLYELSGGNITCQIYPNGQLGRETIYLEKLQTGSLDMAKTSAAPIASFVPRMKVFSFPYLFKDRSNYWQVLDGEIGQGLLESLSDRGEGKPSGLRGLCYYDAGSRNFYTKEAVKTPSDLKGKVIRVMQDPVAIAMTESLGATPKPMGSGEIYGALQRGNIDGAENNPPTFVTQRHYEVCKHFTMDQHSRIPDILAISSKVWEKLSPQEQTWIQTAAASSSRYQRQLWQEKTDAALAEMKRQGVAIYTTDLAPFQEATKDTASDLLTDEISGIIKSIRAQK